MRGTIRLVVCLAVLGVAVFSSADEPGAGLARLEKQRCPKPAEFASVFSFGYGADHMPREDKRFEELVQKVAAGGFNTIHCTHTEQRLALCKKHGLKMMVDLLADPHVYKSADRARLLCEKLRNNPDVWGYNIWNDPFGKGGPGRRRDVNNVRTWDPTHPAYCGTYRTSGMKHLTNADVMGYYDFHWKRGIDQHFPHLLAYLGWAKERDAWFYTWLSATSGRAGKGNFNRNLYSANTAIACGARGVLWFLGTDLMSPKTFAWTERGQDILEVNREIMPLRRELATLGPPTRICSTPITRTPNNAPLPAKKEAMPPGLAKHAFPKGHGIQPAGGEFVLGEMAGPRKRRFVFVANHNAYAGQDIGLKLVRPVPVEIFNRKEGKWQPLSPKAGVVRFPLAPAGGGLLRLGE